jgi:hypothetical protein
MERSKSAVCFWENGQNEPNFSCISALAKLYGVQWSGCSAWSQSVHTAMLAKRRRLHQRRILLSPSSVHLRRFRGQWISLWRHWPPSKPTRRVLQPPSWSIPPRWTKPAPAVPTRFRAGGAGAGWGRCVGGAGGSKRACAAPHGSGGIFTHAGGR